MIKKVLLTILFLLSISLFFISPSILAGLIVGLVISKAIIEVLLIIWKS